MQKKGGDDIVLPLLLCFCCGFMHTSTSCTDQKNQKAELEMAGHG